MDRSLCRGWSRTSTSWVILPRNNQCVEPKVSTLSFWFTLICVWYCTPLYVKQNITFARLFDLSIFWFQRWNVIISYNGLQRNFFNLKCLKIHILCNRITLLRYWVYWPDLCLDCFLSHDFKTISLQTSRSHTCFTQTTCNV